MNSIEQIFGSTNTGPVGKGKPAQEMGQEDFLKLLVAQLQNQDPNNPADNGEFLGQIAQFSMVSGIDELGASFDSVAGSLYSTQAIQAANLVGKEVLAETSAATISEGETVEGLLALEDGADNVRLQVMDSAGSLVRVVDMGSLPAGLQKFSWDGLDDEGLSVPDGTYTVQPEALVFGQLEAVPFQIYTDVESVSVDRASTSVILHLDNEESITLSQVSQYR